MLRTPSAQQESAPPRLTGPPALQGLFLLSPARCLIIRPYADSSELSYSYCVVPPPNKKVLESLPTVGLSRDPEGGEGGLGQFPTSGPTNPPPTPHPPPSKLLESPTVRRLSSGFGAYTTTNRGASRLGRLTGLRPVVFFYWKPEGPTTQGLMPTAPSCPTADFPAALGPTPPLTAALRALGG